MFYHEPREQLESKQLMPSQEIIKPGHNVLLREFLGISRERLFSAGFFQTMVSRSSVLSRVWKIRVPWRIEDRFCHTLYLPQDDTGHSPYFAQLFERSYAHLYLLL